jgi:hypothetical protein
LFCAGLLAVLSAARHVRALLAAGLTQHELLLYLARRAESLTFKIGK